MARPLVPDELCELIEPLIPKVPQAAPVSWSEADRRAEGADGDLVRVADGDPVGVPATGDGLRLGGRRAGAACASGKRRVSGSGCTSCCWRSRTRRI